MKTSMSKFLSFVLRHEPHHIGIELDANGWVAIDRLVDRCRDNGKALDREMLLNIVATCPKQRFAISEDGLRIRASQGHSLEVDLAYESSEPPEFLFHGTIASCLTAIRAEGLQKMARHHVHLSPDIATARTIGARRGKPIILRVAAKRMHDAGSLFYCSKNGVWLTDTVPPQYIELPDCSGTRRTDEGDGKQLRLLKSEG